MTKGTGRQGFIFPLPHLQSLALPRALPQIYRAAALQGLKLTVPIPFPSQLTPPTLAGMTCRHNPGAFLPWMEDSHLLLELPAHSAKEENLLLARARHGIVPHVPHKGWWLWEPLTRDKRGRVALWTRYKMVEHSPIHQTLVV